MKFHTELPVKKFLPTKRQKEVLVTFSNLLTSRGDDDSAHEDALEPSTTILSSTLSNRKFASGAP